VWQGSLTICRGPYADHCVRRTKGLREDA